MARRAVLTTRQREALFALPTDEAPPSFAITC